MRFLVTGGAGFIGSHLVSALSERGDSVLVIDDLSNSSANTLPEGASLEVLDVRSPQLESVIRAYGPGCVIHLAAQGDVRLSVSEPVRDADINILGTLNVLECSRMADVRRIVVAGSGGCMYGEHRTVPHRENARRNPSSPYGISKGVLIDYLTFYQEAYSMEYVLLALSNVYGPRQKSTGEAGVVAMFLGAMLQDVPTTIYGDGRQTRDFLYVTDAVRAFLIAAEKGDGVYNIGTGVETTILDLWRACAALVSYHREPVTAQVRIGELHRNAVDSRRAHIELEWTPMTSLADGLRRTADFISEQILASSLRGLPALSADDTDPYGPTHLLERCAACSEGGEVAAPGDMRVEQDPSSVVAIRQEDA